MPKDLRLPDGSFTKDVELFSDEWDKIRMPLESMGFRVRGFDPGVSLCDAEAGNGHFQLPLYAAKKFITLIPTGNPVSD